MELFLFFIMVLLFFITFFMLVVTRWTMGNQISNLQDDVQQLRIMTAEHEVLLGEAFPEDKAEFPVIYDGSEDEV